METEGEIDLNGPSLLDNDTVPNANQSLYCFSCETPMQGLYCGACGQKNDNYRRSLWSLGVELFTSLTALEGRIWRTWGALLLKPGKVAREFADGRRTHWSSPIRVFLAMSLVLFTYIAITKTQIISADVNIRIKDGVEKSTEDLTPPDLILSGALHMFETQKQINARNAKRNIDLIDIVLQSESSIDYDLIYTSEGFSFKRPSDVLSYDQDTETDEINKTLEEIQAALKESVETGHEAKQETEADALEGSNAEEKESSAFSDFVDGWNNFDGKENDETSDAQSDPYLQINKRQVSQDDIRRNLKRFIRDPSRFNDEISKNLPRVMFFMMPLMMFIGIIFIRGRENALLYDHLVHAAYMHSIFYFLLFVGLLLGRIPWLPGDVITFAILIYLIIYFPMSLRRMFKRSWAKTIWTGFGISSTYNIFMLFIMLYLVSQGVVAQFAV